MCSIFVAQHLISRLLACSVFAPWPMQMHVIPRKTSTLELTSTPRLLLPAADITTPLTSTVIPRQADKSSSLLSTELLLLEVLVILRNRPVMSHVKCHRKKRRKKKKRKMHIHDRQEAHMATMLLHAGGRYVSSVAQGDSPGEHTVLP